MHFECIPILDINMYIDASITNIHLKINCMYAEPIQQHRRMYQYKNHVLNVCKMCILQAISSVVFLFFHSIRFTSAVSINFHCYKSLKLNL